MKLSLFILLGLTAACAQDVTLNWGTYAASNEGRTFNRTGVDAAGNMYFVATSWNNSFRVLNGTNFQGTPGADRNVYVAKYSPAGQLLWGTYIRNFTEHFDLLVDAAGNSYISGVFVSQPGQSSAPFQQAGGFLLSLDTNGRQRFATSAPWMPNSFSYLAAHPAGGVVLCGFGFIGGTIPESIPSDQRTRGGTRNAMITRFTPAGEPVFATYLGDNTDQLLLGCAVDPDGMVHLGFDGRIGGQRQVGFLGYDMANRRQTYFTPAAFGSYGPAKFSRGPGYLWVGGSAGPNFPTTEDAELRTPRDGSSAQRNAFLLKLSYSGQILYSTFVSGSGAGSSAIQAMDTDAAGNVYSCATTNSSTWPVSTNAIQRLPSGTGFSTLNIHNAAGRFVYASYWNELSGSAICSGLAFQPGRVLLTGRSNSTMTGITNPLEAAVANRNDHHWIASFGVQLGTRPNFSAAGVTNAASFAGGAVAAGEIITIFAENAGPAELAGLQLTPQRTVATVTGRTRVLFDGTPAPMIYAVAGQISAVVPYNVAGKSAVDVILEYDNVQSAPVRVPVAASAPGLFTIAGGTGPVVAILESGCCNSAQNAARRGEVVVFYATGEGQTNPPGRDGSLAEYATLAEFPRPVLPVRVTIGGQEAEILYAGAAPGFVAGLMQLNVRLPAGAPLGEAVPVVLQVGQNASRAGVTMTIR